MVIRTARFNIIFLTLAAVLALLPGCRTPDKDKLFGTLRVHLEVPADGTGLNTPVPIYRAAPAMVNIESTAFLTEAVVDEVKVVDDTHGGFALQVRFGQRGAWLLEQYTASHPRHRLAIFATYGNKKLGITTRWLAAPLITRRIADGVLTFTPDADRAEAEQLATGLNNVAKELKRRLSK